MTIEEALTEIKERIHITEYVGSNYVDCVNIEALRMAIEALKNSEQTAESSQNVSNDDSISRKAAIDAMCELMRHWFGCNPKDEIKEIKRELDKLPAVQPEQKKGKWKRTYLDHEAMGERPSIFYCSECAQCVAYPLDYCPNCGARMER